MVRWKRCKDVGNYPNQPKQIIGVIDTVFAYRINPNTERREIVINPELTKSLQEVVELTRKIIVELYVGCEKDFIKGLISLRHCW